MAYGHVSGPRKVEELKGRLYALPSRAVTQERFSLVAWPIDCSSPTSSSGQLPESLADKLHEVFNDELEKGVTYPQRAPMTKEEFRSYFLAYDLVVGVLLSEDQTVTLMGEHDKKVADPAIPKTGIQVDIPGGFFDGVDWNQSYGFSYYIKVSECNFHVGV